MRQRRCDRRGSPIAIWFADARPRIRRSRRSAAWSASPGCRLLSARRISASFCRVIVRASFSARISKAARKRTGNWGQSAVNSGQLGPARRGRALCSIFRSNPRRIRMTVRALWAGRSAMPDGAGTREWTVCRRGAASGSQASRYSMTSFLHSTNQGSVPDAVSRASRSLARRLVSSSNDEVFEKAAVASGISATRYRILAATPVPATISTAVRRRRKTYTWEGANRIVSYSNGTTTSTFTYDGLGRLVRVVDTVNGNVTADHSSGTIGNDLATLPSHPPGCHPLTRLPEGKSKEVDAHRGICERRPNVPAIDLDPQKC